MRGAHRPDTQKKGRPTGRVAVSLIIVSMGKDMAAAGNYESDEDKNGLGEGGLGVRCERRRCNCMTIECPLLAYTNHSRLSRIIDRRFSHRSTSQPESQHIFWRVNDFRLNGNHTSRPGATVDRTTICRNRLEKDSIGPIGR